MCGRFVSVAGPDDLAAFFDAEPPDTDLGANYNVAPTNDIYAVIADPAGNRSLQVFEWGLIPPWSADDRRRAATVNARAETVRTKPMFRDAFARRRCLVPMSGFYEWLPAEVPVGEPGRSKPVKQPVLIERTDRAPLAVAGLWAAWRPRGSDPSEPWRHTCAVITTEPNADLRPVHDRMPVLLERSEWTAWLDPHAGDLSRLEAMLDPAPDGVLEYVRVSTTVNSVRNRGPFERL